MRTPLSRPLVLSTDNVYAPAAATCLTSIFLNSPHLEFDTFVVTTKRKGSAATPVFKNALARLSATFDRRIEILSIDDRCFDSFNPPSQLPYLGNVTYNWFLVPSIIPHDSFLLLDSDIVVQHDLDFLLSLDIAQNMLAGVANDTSGENERLGLPPEEIYINTGVMVVNAALWRQDHVLDAIFEWNRLNQRELRLADQDIVNSIFVGRKAILDSKWNTQLHTIYPAEREKFDPDSFSGIFHFSGESKPWLPGSHEPIRRLYEKYARVSPMRMPEAS